MSLAEASSLFIEGKNSKALALGHNMTVHKELMAFRKTPVFLGMLLETTGVHHEQDTYMHPPGGLGNDWGFLLFFLYTVRGRK
jgi:hypothetical protein